MRIPLTAPQRHAKAILGNAAARAYSLVRPDETNACVKCGGDGCHACYWTGEQK